MSAPDAPFPLDQYEALRTGRGTADLAGWSSLTLTGGDRQTFLHNFCTNDVKRLKPGESCEAFITNVKGRILGHGLVHCRDDELGYITVPGQAPAIIAHLDRYIIGEDVQLRDTTAERAYLLVTGSAVVGLAIPWDLLDAPFCRLVETTHANMPRVRQTLVEQGAMLCGEPTFDALRIESRTPLFGRDFNGDNLPQEVGRNDRAISFTKGCYLGQETVARIDALGHVNQQLTGVRFAGPEIPPAGTELTHSGAAAGRVTSATFSPRLGVPLALALVRREWLAPGCRLESAAGPGEVIELPLPP